MSIYEIPEDDSLYFWSWETSLETNLTMFVYVIQQGDDGPVKIGVSNNPSRRLRELQTGNPEHLTLILQRPGLISDEHRLHYLLSAYKMEGEWFEFCLPVKAVLEELIP